MQNLDTKRGRQFTRILPIRMGDFHQPSVELVVQWLREHGGHCDCAVIYDVEEKFGPLVGR
jgi:hypothetical protein